MKTDLQSIKDKAIALLYIEPEPIPELPIFLTHPYFESRAIVLPNSNKFVDIIDDSEALQIVRDDLQAKINSVGSAEKVFMFLRPQYRLTLFKYTNQYMSPEDFKEVLLFSWIMVEYPLSDVNVTKNEMLRWFGKLNFVSDFSGVVTIYRGVGSEKYRDGISWTLAKSKAEWFATRFTDNGIVYSAKVKSKDILYYISERGEEEIIVDPKKLMQIERIN